MIPADFHLNGHKKYSDKIEAYLTELYDNAPSNMEKAYDELTKYTGLVKKKIEENPTLTLSKIADLIPQLSRASRSSQQSRHNIN